MLRPIGRSKGQFESVGYLMSGNIWADPQHSWSPGYWRRVSPSFWISKQEVRLHDQTGVVYKAQTVVRWGLFICICGIIYDHIQSILNQNFLSSVSSRSPSSTQQLSNRLCVGRVSALPQAQSLLEVTPLRGKSALLFGTRCRWLKDFFSSLPSLSVPTSLGIS